VSAISARDVWAAGLNDGGSLLLHWNGAAWSQYLTSTGYFIGVAASSARDVWAVGGTNWFSPTKTLAQHWNGTSWTQVATPSPAGGGYFNAVAARSPRDAWAVGLAGPGPGVPSPTVPLIEHWNGTAWTVRTDQAPAAGGEFAAAAATSASDAWAVGWTGPASEGTGQRTLIEHWNGTRWKVIPSPNPPSGYLNILDAASAVSRDNIWAVGATDYASTLVAHWNGASWS
jgi:hypothetical protein